LPSAQRLTPYAPDGLLDIRTLPFIMHGCVLPEAEIWYGHG
jgi:hypothetical protein